MYCAKCLNFLFLLGNDQDRNQRRQEFLTEVTGDLFSAPEHFSLGHCVGSDFRMGAGIAVTFRWVNYVSLTQCKHFKYSLMDTLLFCLYLLLLKHLVILNITVDWGMISSQLKTEYVVVVIENINVNSIIYIVIRSYCGLLELNISSIS